MEKKVNWKTIAGIVVLLMVAWLILYLFLQSMLIPIFFTLVGFSLIFIVSQMFKEIYGSYTSVQFWIIIVGTLVVIIISWFKDSIFPNFDNLSIEASKLFLPLLVDVIVGIFAISGIAFSILWGSIYVHYLKEGEHGNELKKLKHQGIFLLVFLSYFVFVLFFLFIQPLYLQINV
jgi:hypothetical protein